MTKQAHERAIQPGCLILGERKQSGFFLMAARFARVRLVISGTLKAVHHTGGGSCIPVTHRWGGFLLQNNGLSCCWPKPWQSGSVP